jgi:DNA-binding response OmpR family regulator
MRTIEVMDRPTTTTDGQTDERGRMHVLVIDDDEWIRELVGMTLTEEGYGAYTAPDGAAALALLEELARDGRRAPDLILLDMRMPAMDGWAFAKAYRDRRLSPAPIVVITAATDAAQCAADIGADGALAKPFLIEELLAVVHAFTHAPRRST